MKSAQKIASLNTRKTPSQKTYLVIETYKEGKAKEVYNRFSEKGRMIPSGVVYINSWVQKDLQKCYQIMESESWEKLNEWIDYWKDLVDFEVIPVMSSEVASQIQKEKK